MPAVSTPKASAIFLNFSPVYSALNSMTMGSIMAQATPWGVSYTAPRVWAMEWAMPIVMEFNAEYTGEKFKKIAEAFGVEVNEEFAEREDWETIQLKEGDKVDFLYFMGGGAW